MARAAMLLTFFLVQSLYAQNAKEPFFVMTRGLKGEREALQVKAELQMARDTRYCRGAMIPAAQKNWSCEGVGPGVERCEREYKCARVRPDLSRLSETRRLIEQQKKLSAVSGEHQISTRPEVKLARVSLPAANASLKKERGIPLRNQTQTASAVTVGRSAPSSQTQRPAAPTSTDPILSFRQEQSSMDTVSSWQDEQDREDIEELLLEEPTAPTKSSMNEKRNEEADVTGLQFLRAAVTYLQASDDFGESQSTFNFAWVPRYRFANGFGLRAQLGFHQYTIPLEEEETFTVIDTFGLLQYTFWEKWTVEVGLGQQKWSTEYLAGVSGTMLGVSYELGHPWLDTLSVQTTSLSGSTEDELTQENISELRFSFAVSF